MTVDPSEVPVTDLATKSSAQQSADEPIDEELLAEAQRHLGLSADGAVNEALRRLVDEERGKRHAAQEHLWTMFDEGAFDFSKLDAADE
jgi:predicted component of type VI protein secretion system